jgi:AraC family transcriptional regulator
METYVPAAITVVRRSSGWPGILLQERHGGAGEVNYPAGLRQHVFYRFLRPLRTEVLVGGATKAVHYRSGEARFTPAGQPVAFRWSGEVRVVMLGFQPWFFERVAAEIGANAALPGAINTLKLAAEHPAGRLMEQLRGELHGAAGASLVAEGLARAVAVLLLREFATLPRARTAEAAPPVAVLRAVELMRRRLDESLTLEELAEVAGLSPFHFARQFKTATGHPPHDYLVRLRVDRAQELIRHHGREWTMAAIAQETGFADQSHMARHFKRVLGVSPREFAEARSR